MATPFGMRSLSSGVASSKASLLADAASQRAERKFAKAQAAAALLIQRVWRGRRSSEAFRLDLLRCWTASATSTSAGGAGASLHDTLLPPLLLCARRGTSSTRGFSPSGLACVGAPRLTTCLALVLQHSRQYACVAGAHQAAAAAELAVAALRWPPPSSQPALLAAAASRALAALCDACPAARVAEARPAAAAVSDLLRRRVESNAPQPPIAGGGELTARSDAAVSALLAVLLRACDVSTASSSSPGAADAAAAADAARLIAGAALAPRVPAPPCVVSCLRAAPLAHLRAIVLASATSDSLARAPDSSSSAPSLAAAWATAHAAALCLPDHPRLFLEALFAADARAASPNDAAAGGGWGGGAIGALASEHEALCSAAAAGASPACRQYTNEALNRLCAAPCVASLLGCVRSEGAAAISSSASPPAISLPRLCGACFCLALVAPPSAPHALVVGSVAAAQRRRHSLLSALAFSPLFLRVAWPALAAELCCSETLQSGGPAAQPIAPRKPFFGAPPPASAAAPAPSPAQPAADASACALDGGVASLSLSALRLLLSFTCALSHLLIVAEDDEIHGAPPASVSAFPLSLPQLRAASKALNRLAISTATCVRPPPPSKQQQQQRSAEHAALARAAAEAVPSCARAMKSRDDRRPFAPPGFWLADDARSSSSPSALSAAATRALLSSLPHALPFEARVAEFRRVCSPLARQQQPSSAGAARVARLVVRRSHLLEDSLPLLLDPADVASSSRLVVSFVNAAGAPEAGVDAGGLFKEWLTDVVASLFDPNRGIWAPTQPGGLLRPTRRAATTPEGLTLLRASGCALGRALAAGMLLPLGGGFAPFFCVSAFSAPLHRDGATLSLDDLPSLDAALHRSLVSLKRMDPSDVASLYLDFTASAGGDDDDGGGGGGAGASADVVELVDGGSSIPVTSDNRLAYVALLADWRLRGAGARGVAAFRSGLASVAPPPTDGEGVSSSSGGGSGGGGGGLLAALALFSPAELNQLVCGGETDAFDVDDLAAHARIGSGYTPTSRSVVDLWAVLSSFTPQQRSDVLRFVTSSPRPPLGGFAHLHPPFTVVRADGGGAAARGASGLLPPWLGGRPGAERLPSASTCFNTLKLPDYRSRTTLRAKLLYAICSASGFDLS